MNRRYLLFTFLIVNPFWGLNQWNLKSGGYHEFVKMDDKNLTKWNHANGLYLGMEYILKNQILISSSLNYYKHNSHSARTSINPENQKITTFFQGKINYLALDLSFGYSFKMNNNSFIQLTFGTAHFVKINTKIIETYKKTQYFEINSNEKNTPYLTTKTFFNGTSDNELNQSFKEKVLNIRFIPFFNLNYRYSFSDEFSLDIFSRYTLNYGNRFGVGIIYKLFQPKK